MTTNTIEVLWMNNKISLYMCIKNHLVFNVHDDDYDDDNDETDVAVHESARIYSSPEMRQTHAPKFQRRDNYTICFNWACCLWIRFKFKFLPHKKILFARHTYTHMVLLYLLNCFFFCSSLILSLSFGLFFSVS